MSRVLLERPPDVDGMMNKQKQTFGIFLSLSNSAWDFLGLLFCRNFFFLWGGGLLEALGIFFGPQSITPLIICFWEFFSIFLRDNTLTNVASSGEATRGFLICHWFSPLLREIFLRVLRLSPLQKIEAIFPNFNSIQNGGWTAQHFV